MRTHRPPDFSRWHTGLGLVRRCWLETLPADYVVPGSVAITTPSVSKDSATVKVMYKMSKSGAKEKVFDQMDNDFGWHYLPKGLLKENTVFMILTAIIRNFYKLLLRDSRLRAFGIQAGTRMKAFINKVVAVVARWTRGGRRDILTVYTDNAAAFESLYADYG